MIEEQVKKYPIMLYMKGTPRQPQCGFSGQAVRLLNAVGADFSSVNVLEFPAIRDGIKAYSDWPTIPQLYINGDFIGGCDIMTQVPLPLLLLPLISLDTLNIILTLIILDVQWWWIRKAPKREETNIADNNNGDDDCDEEDDDDSKHMNNDDDDITSTI